MDETLPLKTRRQAARGLARLSSDEAIAALKTALGVAPAYLKAAIAEGLGESSHAEARAWLLDLVRGGDDVTARGALRGLAVRGDTEAVEVLGDVLFNGQSPESMRTEAARALGEINLPGALATLTRAAGEIQDPALLENILEGLGKRPYAETREFFERYLEMADLPGASKVAALEALGNAAGDVTPVLLKYASDSDEEVRAAAAWGLSATLEETEIGPQLVALLQQESNAEVRARLLQALLDQPTFDVAAVLALTRNETDPEARLAGLDVLAEACRSRSDPEASLFFNQTAVAELTATALRGSDPSKRLKSVMTLRRAGTADALQALRQIGQDSTDPKLVEAVHAGLRAAAR